MRLLTLFSLILAAATVIATMSGTGRCMVVHDDADAQTFTAMATATNRFKHTPDQRIAAYTNLVTASSKYAKSYAGNAAFAATNGLDYADVKAYVDSSCTNEIYNMGVFRGRAARVRALESYTAHGITPAAVVSVSNDVYRIKSEQSK